MVAPRITFCDVPLDPWTMEQTVAEIGLRLHTKTFTQHVVINVSKFIHMLDDDTLCEAVCTCDIINADGMGIVWGARFLGIDIPERVSGIDLFFNLLTFASHRGHSVFFLGAKEDVLERTISVLRARCPTLRIAGWHHGYFWDDEQSIVEKIRRSNATLLFVGITSPKKEQFISRHRDKLGVKFAMGVGGSFDIVAGEIKRAPLWMQKAGLEWFYRTVQEPRRMWKRYLTTNSKFLYILLKEWLRQ